MLLWSPFPRFTMFIIGADDIHNSHSHVTGILFLLFLALSYSCHYPFFFTSFPSYEHQIEVMSLLCIQDSDRDTKKKKHSVCNLVIPAVSCMLLKDW